MKSNVIGMAVAGLLISCTCYAEYPEANLKVLGYSDSVLECIDNDFGLTCFKDDELKQEELSEVDSTVEQLKELAVSRSITVTQPDRSEEIKQKNSAFWADIYARNKKYEPVVVSEETKAQIKVNIYNALVNEGYKVIQLDILPLAEGSSKEAVRALVRVVKTMKTGSYNEVQSRLNSIKDICCKAATINDKCMLSEMTTFIAENPKNNYYYEKTILK